MADNNNNNNINQGAGGNVGGGNAGVGGMPLGAGGILGAGPGYVANGGQRFGPGAFGGPGGPGGFGPGGFGPAGLGGAAYGGQPFGAFNAPFANPMGGMAGMPQFNYGMNNFDGNFGMGNNFGNPGMVGNYGMGGNVVMGATGNLRHHAGFGPAPGPGTGGRDMDGNVFMPSGQYAPGGGITLRDCFAVCGFMDAEIATIMTHVPDIDSVLRLRSESITSLEKNLNGGANPFVMQSWRTTLLRGLMHWAQDNERCNRNPMMAHVLTRPMLQAAIERDEARKRMVARQAAISADTAPAVFVAGNDFYRWAETMFNHLNTIIGVRGIPLSYVIRANENPQFDMFDTIDMQFIKLAPLHGEQFRNDSTIVHNIIIGKTGPDVVQFLRSNHQISNGRADMQTLFNIYTGYGNREARLAQARATETSLHYRDERMFSFTKFLHSAQNMFEILYENGQGLNDDQKCQFLLDKCAGCSYLADNIKTCRDRKHDGTLSYPYMISLFTSTIATHQSSVRANRTSDNRVSETTVAATSATKMDAEKKYKDADWYKMPIEKRNAILDLRRQLGIPNTPRGGKIITRSATRKLAEISSDDTAIESSIATVSPEEQAILERVVKRLATAKQGPATVATTVTSNTSSTISSVAGNSFGGRHEATNHRSSHLSPLSSSDRRLVANVSHNITAPVETVVGNIELDTHADTCVLGHNFVVLSYTSRVTDVYGYSPELGAIKNIPIVTGATAVDNPTTGETIILVVNEALWYGNRLDHSLLNPNQLRHYGCVVHDNPYDYENPMSIAYGPNILLDLTTKGTLIYGKSRTPTQYELEHCPHHIITSDNLWNPHTVNLSVLHTDADTHIDPYTSAYLFCVIDQTVDDDYRILGDTSTMLDCRILHCADTEYGRIVAAIGKVKEDLPFPHTFISTKRHTDVLPEDLSERWMIGIEQAKATIEASTQHYVRSAILPMSRRYRTDRYFYRNRLDATFSADIYYGRCTSGRGNKYCFIIAHPNGFCVAYPQKSRTTVDTTDSLKLFTRVWGVPTKLIVDGGQEMIGHNTPFVQHLKYHNIELHVSESKSPQQNPAEGIIREIRKKWNRLKTRKNVHERLWDYAVVWICEVMQQTVSSSRYANRRTPIELLTGETPDISEYLDFSFYDWVIFKVNVIIGDTELGRYLGVSHSFGNLMTYSVINQNGKVMSRSTVQRVTNIELQQEEMKHKCLSFTQNLHQHLGDPQNHIIVSGMPDQFYIEHEADEHRTIVEAMHENDVSNVPGNKTFTPDSVDPLINTKIMLPRGLDNRDQIGTVVKRLKDVDGNPIGTRNDNPQLDSRLYEVIWPDGSTEHLFANIISGNMYSKSQGEISDLFYDIVDHRTTDTLLSGDNAYDLLPNGTRRIKPTTSGWQICIQWKDGSTDWAEMNDVKDSYPVQLADYAARKRLDKEPAFAWWIPHVKRQQRRGIHKLKNKYWMRTHKFGVEIPKSVAEAIQIDKRNGNHLWQEAIEKEMENIIPAFLLYDDDPKKLIGFQLIKCHMIFDVKLGENFRRKARFVAGGHMTSPPATLTYASVVSRESVRIALVLASLNGMIILTADIQNAYLHANCREKIYIIAGKEFGSNEGKPMIITKALYGLKSSGAAFRSLLAEQLDHIGYTATRGDPDVWIRPIMKDGRKFYEYVLVYVDDLLVVSFNPQHTMDQLSTAFKFKQGSIKTPDSFLGAQLSFNTNQGRNCWVISSQKYIRAACETIKDKMEQRHKIIPFDNCNPEADFTFPDPKGRKATTPFNSKYRPELDITRELDEEEITFFQEMIGILRWTVELGRCDILLEVSLLSSHLSLPRLGHIQAACHIFNYLHFHPTRSIFMDHRYPTIDATRFHKADWTDFYRHSVEPIPNDIPTPLGEPVEIHCFVDASHASDVTSRKSQTGILIFLNRAPIFWYSKKQTNIESSTFGAEFVAMKTAVELIRALRLKLRWMGIPFYGPANVYCDNMTVFTSSTQPEVTLSKKHNGIAYHICREAVAIGMIRVAHEPTDTNLADLFTKILVLCVRSGLIDRFMY